MCYEADVDSDAGRLRVFRGRTGWKWAAVSPRTKRTGLLESRIMQNPWPSEFLVSDYDNRNGLRVDRGYWAPGRISVRNGIHFYVAPARFQSGLATRNLVFPTWISCVHVKVAVFGHGYLDREKGCGVAESAVIQRIIVPAGMRYRTLRRLRAQYPFAEVVRDTPS